MRESWWYCPLGGPEELCCPAASKPAGGVVAKREGPGTTDWRDGEAAAHRIQRGLSSHQQRLTANWTVLGSPPEGTPEWLPVVPKAVGPQGCRLRVRLSVLLLTVHTPMTECNGRVPSATTQPALTLSGSERRREIGWTQEGSVAPSHPPQLPLSCGLSAGRGEPGGREGKESA